MKTHSTYLVSALCAVAEFSVGADASYASWFGHRGVQVRNIIALEGGILSNGTFTPADGTWQNSQIISAIGGVYRTLNLSNPFTVGQNVQESFTATANILRDGSSQNFIHGAMFHNDASWYTFAGQPSKNRTYSDDNSVRRGALFGSGAGSFFAGAQSAPDGQQGVHENISAALYVSSPDPGQGKGWFLGGMNKADYGFFQYPLRSGQTITPSNTFFEVDMKTSNQYASFKALTAPADGARAEGQLIWLPFGQQGVLLALGGVSNPSDLYPSAPPLPNTTNSFMSNLSIYDIAGGQWYTQSTLESGIDPAQKPAQLAGFCSAVVPSKDKLSQEIIIYGGYDGTGKGSPPVNDDVWILSIPAFEWTHVVKSSNDSHARYGSVCFAPNPTTFLTVGGSKLSGLPLGSDTFLDVLDLNTMKWGGTYDPSANESFLVPEAVATQLKWPNRNGPGSRTIGNVNSAVSSLFSTAYPTYIRENYPYNTPSTTASSTPTNPPNPVPNPWPAWKIAVVVIFTVIPALIILGLLIWCCRRRKHGAARTRNNRSNVRSWLGGGSTIDPHPEKSEGFSDDTAINSPSQDYIPSMASPRKNPTDIYEVGHNPARSPGLASTTVASTTETYEIADTSRGSMSIQRHPFYPHPITGQPSEARSEIGSEPVSSNHRPTELPPNRSGENLSVPSSGVSVGGAPVSTIARKPVGERRTSTPLPSPTTPEMGHARGMSEISSTGLTASPNTEHRQSRHIDNLPDMPGLGEGRATPTGHGRTSVYKEGF